MIFKFFWVLRALCYAPFFNKFKFPSYIGKPVFIKGFKQINIGSRVRIFPHARLEVIDRTSSITFEDNISIGQNFHIISAGNLVIGKNTTIAENVMVTNIDHDYTEIGKHMLDQKNIITETSIGENCFLGFGVVIQAGTTLGKHCVVGANAVVKGDFPDYSVIVGVPARIVKRYNKLSGAWQKTNPDGSFKQ